MPGMTSIWHWLIVLLVVVLLFGAGRISNVMGDLGKGIKSFKRGLNESDEGDTPAQTSQPQSRITDERPAEQRAAAQPTADLDKR